MLPVASQEVFALSIAPSNSRQLLYPSSGCSSRASQYSTLYGLRCLIASKSGLDMKLPPQNLLPLSGCVSSRSSMRSPVSAGHGEWRLLLVQHAPDHVPARRFRLRPIRRPVGLVNCEDLIAVHVQKREQVGGSAAIEHMLARRCRDNLHAIGPAEGQPSDCNTFHTLSSKVFDTGCSADRTSQTLQYRTSHSSPGRSGSKGYFFLSSSNAVMTTLLMVVWRRVACILGQMWRSSAIESVRPG